MRWNGFKSARGASWYLAESLSPRARLGLALGLLVLTWIVQVSPLGEWMLTSLQRPLAFRVRSALHHDPTWHPKLFVYAFGDSTVQAIGREELTLDEWATVFGRLSSAGVRMIVVDKLFSLVPNAAEAARFEKALASLSTPLVTGVFAPPQTRLIQGMSLPSGPTHDIGLWTKDPQALNWLPIENVFPKGPHHLLAKVLSRPGHLQFEPDGFIRPLMRSARNRLLPMAEWFIDDKATLGSSGARLGGKLLPLDDRLRLQVNLGPPRMYASHLTALYDLLDPKEPVKAQAGDTVLILSAHSSFRSTFTSSPWGQIPVGLLHIALANSVLSGEWIGPVAGSEVFPTLACVAAGVLAWAVPGALFVPGALLLLVVLFAGGLSCFVIFGGEIPWLLSAGAFFFAAAAPRLVDLLLRLRSTRSLLDHFEGLLPADKLQALANDEGRLWLEPGSRVVSVLFLDIVGFSVIAERRPPQEVFHLLKERYQVISDVVLKWGGIIDKTLGDGMLCFFGLDAKGQTEKNHADQAVGCALEIQRANAQMVVQAGPGVPVFPYRVGVNSAAVVLGDLGSRRRVDFTLIGHGVNLAKRLETACEPFRVMIGQTTASLLTNPEGFGAPLLPRIIPIKHDMEGIAAIEINPLERQESLESKVLTAYREFAQLERKEDRAAVTAGTILVQFEKFGEAELVNFSKGGLSFRMPRYLGTGLIVNGQVFAPAKGDEPCFPHTLIAEIRWGRPDGLGRFLHGARIQNLDAAQREEFQSVLSRLNSPETGSVRRLRRNSRR